MTIRTHRNIAALASSALGLLLLATHSSSLAAQHQPAPAHPNAAAPAAPPAAPPARAAVIDTVAGDGKAANVGQPFGVEIGPDGGLYVCEVENHRVRRLDLKTGELTLIAGSGDKGYAGDGGPAIQALLNEPYEIRFDPQGHLYIVERLNHVVRRVDARTGVISTLAGTGKPGYSGDGGPAASATLKEPHSIALDGRGGLYIADILNHRIRRVDLATGVIQSIAGNGQAKPPQDDADPAGKPIAGPRALFIHERTLWVALREGHSVWALDLDTQRLRRIAGTGRPGYKDGPAAEAQFNGPKGVCLSPGGFVDVVDTENQVIRRIDPRARTVHTLAGAGPKARGYRGDGGDALQAWLDRPHGIGVGPDGTLYIGDSNNHRVRRLRLPPTP